MVKITQTPLRKFLILLMIIGISVAALLIFILEPLQLCCQNFKHLVRYYLSEYFWPLSLLSVAVILIFTALRRNNKIFLRKNVLNIKQIAKLNYIIDSIPMIILIMDNHGIIRMANRMFYNYSGMTPGETIGASIRDIDGIRDFSDEYEQIWQTILTGEKWKGESVKKISGGKTYWEKTTIFPCVDRDNNITDVILMGEDITLSKVAEKEIKESKSIKMNFSSMVSHELRTPLTVINEIINIVLRGSVGEINAEQRDFLETAKRNIDRLSRLVNNVLDFQKFGSGKMPFYLLDNNMNEVVLEIYRSMSLLAKDKGLEFDLELDNNLPNIKFDRDKVIQVLTNLVNNAIKFTESGSIKIVSTRGNNVIHIIVTDTGIGMPKDEMSKLFKPFEQLGNPETRPSGGTGLGLVISKEIIIKHRGRIWAESEFGKGSSFHFILPIDEQRK